MCNTITAVKNHACCSTCGVPVIKSLILINIMLLIFVLKFKYYRLKTACMDINNAGTLKESKNISAAFSLFCLGLSGASVNRTGCCVTKFKNINISLYQCEIQIEFYLLSKGVELFFAVDILPHPLHVRPIINITMFHRIL